MGGVIFLSWVVLVDTVVENRFAHLIPIALLARGKGKGKGYDELERREV